MSKQLAEAEHHAVDKGKKKVYGGAAYYGPYRGRLIEDHGRGRGGRGRAARDVLRSGVVLAVRVDRDAGFAELA